MMKKPKKPFLLSKARIFIGEEISRAPHGIINRVKAKHGKRAKKLVVKQVFTSLPVNRSKNFSDLHYKWSRLLHLFKANGIPIPSFVKADIRAEKFQPAGFKKGLYLSDLTKNGKYKVYRINPWGTISNTGELETVAKPIPFSLAKKIIHDIAIMNRLGYHDPVFDALCVIEKENKLERYAVDMGEVTRIFEDKTVFRQNLEINSGFIAGQIKTFVSGFEKAKQRMLLDYYTKLNPNSRISRKLEKIIQTIQN